MPRREVQVHGGYTLTRSRVTELRVPQGRKVQGAKDDGRVFFWGLVAAKL